MSGVQGRHWQDDPANGSATGRGRTAGQGAVDGPPPEEDADLAAAVRATTRMRTAFYVVVLLIALGGQVSGAMEALAMPWYVALPAVGALELGGMVVLANADVRRRLGEHATLSRLLSAAIAGGAVAFNWLAHDNHLEGGFYGGMSLLGYLVWLMNTENKRRDRLRAKRQLPPTPPAYEVVGHWLRHPMLTRRARSLAKAAPGLGLYGSLDAARTQVRIERRQAALAKVLRRKIRRALDGTTADIAVAVYDLDEIARRLAERADYDGLTALIAADLAPARVLAGNLPAGRRRRWRRRGTPLDAEVLASAGQLLTDALATPTPPLTGPDTRAVPATSHGTTDTRSIAAAPGDDAVTRSMTAAPAADADTRSIPNVPRDDADARSIPSAAHDDEATRTVAGAASNGTRTVVGTASNGENNQTVAGASSRARDARPVAGESGDDTGHEPVGSVGSVSIAAVDGVAPAAGRTAPGAAPTVRIDPDVTRVDPAPVAARSTAGPEELPDDSSADVVDRPVPAVAVRERGERPAGARPDESGSRSDPERNAAADPGDRSESGRPRWDALTAEVSAIFSTAQRRPARTASEREAASGRTVAERDTAPSRTVAARESSGRGGAERRSVSARIGAERGTESARGTDGGEPLPERGMPAEPEQTGSAVPLLDRPLPDLVAMAATRTLPPSQANSVPVAEPVRPARGVASVPSSSEGSLRARVHGLLDEEVPAGDDRENSALTDLVVTRLGLGPSDRATVAKYVSRWRSDLVAGRRTPNADRRARTVPGQ